MINWFKKQWFVLPLQINHGIEIGAALAYSGHYKALKDPEVKKIALEELDHMRHLDVMLAYYDTRHCTVIDFTFLIIGIIVSKLCLIAPEFLLTKVALSLEIFAMWSYKKLADRYPDHYNILLHMHDTELKHKEYFLR
tara:strand:- start:43477 stop:43890 length:414 start_codon:yes stop_codon:yes gene_type:complete